MSETTVDPNRVAAATAEADAVATLHSLNAHYIRAFVESDTTWYSEHLSERGPLTPVGRTAQAHRGRCRSWWG